MIKNRKIYHLCENYFCIYWRDYSCIRTEIVINIAGVCDHFKYVEIDEYLLEKKRREQLRSGEEEW